MQSVLRRLLPSPGLFVAVGLLLVPTSLALAYLVMWWTRGIAVPVLGLAGLWYWLLRAPGPLNPRHRAAVKVWGVLMGFFLIGPLFIDTFRLAILALLLLVAFKPGRAP